MELLDNISKALKNGDVMGAVAKEFFPETLSGFLNEYLVGMTARDFYYKVKEAEGKGLLGYLDPGSQQRLKSLVPEDLSWLDLKWLVEHIYEEHPDITSLIFSSTYVRNELERQINILKKECGQ